MSAKYRHQTAGTTPHAEHVRTGNLSPYIEKEPVPSPLMKSPPSTNNVSLITVWTTSHLTLAHEVWDADEKDINVSHKVPQASVVSLTL